MGDKLKNALTQKLGQHPNVGDIRGRGLFVGIELVQDRETKLPFAIEDGLAGKIKKTTFEAGLICYPMAGTRDGKFGDHILLAPPFILEDEHIEEIVEKISCGIDAAILTD
jgi:adenosylmethionine-8-amino-7-oxononanoate aminotransferase